MHRDGVRIENLHLQDGKLYVRGIAPSQEIKNHVWNEIKLIDRDYPDLIADIAVSPEAQPPVAPAAGVRRTYVVKPGDTLSRIAAQFYGSSRAFNRIFAANRDKLSNPDEIVPGLELVIPE